MLSGPLPAVLTSHGLQNHLPPPLSLQSFLPFILSLGLTSHCMPPAEFLGLGQSTVGHSSLLFSPEPRSSCQDLVPPLPKDLRQKSGRDCWEWGWWGKPRAWGGD